MPNYTLAGGPVGSQALTPLIRFEEKDDEAAIQQAKRTAKASSIIDPKLFRIEEIKVDFKS